MLPPKHQRCPEDLLPQDKFTYTHPNLWSPHLRRTHVLLAISALKVGGTYQKAASRKPLSETGSFVLSYFLNLLEKNDCKGPLIYANL